MLKHRLPVAALISLFLGGCYVNRAILDPYGAAPSSPSEFWKPPKRALASPSDVAQTIPNTETPLSLAEVIDIALRNNTETRMTWAEARTSAAAYAQTQSSQLPQITGDFAYSRYRTSTTFNNIVETYWQSEWGPELNVSYIVFDFGQRRATSEAARQALYFADWTHNRMIQTVLDTVTNNYYNYLYQKQLYVSLEADVANAKTTFDEASLGLETGVKNISDVLQAKTQLLQRQTELVAQQQKIVDSYAVLLSNMGVPASTSIKLEEIPQDIPHTLIQEDTNEMIQRALEKRADLLAAEANLRAAEENVTAAKRQFFPTLEYNFDFGRTYFSEGGNDDYNLLSAFVLNIPIFYGFSLQNSVRQAKAQKEQAEAQLRQAQLQVIEDVTTAHSSVKVAFETLGYAQGFLKSAQEQFKVALAQYKEGTADILTVISAQTALANARSEVARSFQQWFSSLANLAYAAGTLSPDQSKNKEGS